VSVLLVTVGKDQEVLETVQAAVADLGIVAGAITLIGAVQESTISVMKKDDALADYLRSYDQPFELTGTGEVVDGKVHLHVTLAGEDVIAAGHLHSSMVRTFFVHAYVTPLS
jgi:predicted DNA-binding protein with PD1-like motif